MTDSDQAVVPSTYQPPRSTNDLVLRWIGRARESQFAHYDEAGRLRRMTWYLGLPVVLLTSSIATAQVVTLVDVFKLPFDTQVMTIALSTLAAIFSALQTIAQPTERAERHRSSGGAYGSVRRELEQLYASSATSGIWDADRLNSVRHRLDALASDAPHLPIKTFSKVRTTLDELPSKS